MGTSKPSVVETNVSQSAGSKASLALVGRIAPRRAPQSLAFSRIVGKLIARETRVPHDSCDAGRG
jgi:hypothetical protein